MEIKFTISDTKIQKIINTMKWLFPIPQIPVDPLKPELGVKNEFTDSQWAKEAIRRWITEQVYLKELSDARNAVNILPKDDSLII